MEKKALLFIVVAIIIIGAVYLAFPALFNNFSFNFSDSTNEVPAKPVITEFFLKLDPVASTISWQANMFTGTLNFRFGEIGRDKEGHVTGTIAADAGSLRVLDDQVAEIRLKSKEFFESDRYPNVELAVTSLDYFGPVSLPDQSMAESYAIHGNLTIHGVTQEVRVPLLVVVEGNRIIATGQLNLSRDLFRLGPRDPSLPDEVVISVKLVSQEASSQP